MAIPSSIDCWQSDAHSLWLQGAHQAAINQLLERINAAAPSMPRAIGLQFTYYLFLLGDLASAESFLRRLLAIYPDDPEILENLAVMVSRQGGRQMEAVPLFQQACELRPVSANAWDGLANVLSKSGRYSEARQAGERALALKTETAKPLLQWSPPDVTPQAYLQRPGFEDRIDCVSFSIWGSNPRYLRGGLRNALLIPELFPGWLARFYLDDSVPTEFVSLLTSLGSEVRMMPSAQSMRQKLCWRFLVANDPGVNRFLVRDCDSVVSTREVNAVQQWLVSGHWFHVMRDWWTHTDPMLAGLWGGVAGALPDLQSLLTRYKPAAAETANIDQWFLRDVLWGSIRAYALIHDRCYRSEGSVPWPDPDPAGNVHVGQDEFAVRRGYQSAWLSHWIRSCACLQLPDESGSAEG